MARAVRNTFKESGTLLPRSAITPRAKAMSVATGTPHPAIPSPPQFTAAYIPAGTTMPPRAATTARAASLGAESSPVRTSRFISSPTRKKKRAISPSLTQCSKDSSNSRPATPMPRCISRMAE